ncbi:MAG TPA: glycerate kinase [Bryobacteraceae bacterium]|nr:glycerate kinase [Bryobacteraceae bacterium]
MSLPPIAQQERGLRKTALAIFGAALQAADPAEAVLRHVRVEHNTLIAGRRRYALNRFKRIQVIGAGKASAAMARAVEHLLGARISGGLINVKYGHSGPLKRVRINECGHPVPDESGLRGALKIAAIAQNAGEDDLLLCLISGGASALLPAPAPPIMLDEKQETTKALLACGATIHEINAVRKHISTLKGGQLARLAQPATVLALLLSDVIGDDLDVIGSGPAAPDASTFADALEILSKYKLTRRVPASVRRRLQQGAQGKIPETPKPTDPIFGKVQNLIVGGSRQAIQAAAEKAREGGFRTLLLSTTMEGETREVARVHAAIAREALVSGQPARPPLCLLSGGETTVTLRGHGMGGRNQEFVLAAALDIAGLKNVVVLSAGTDGTDGPTDAAGAIADGQTIARAVQLQLDARRFLADNDSYRFFEKLGGLLKTGPTGTNVMDIRIVLIGG